VNFATFALRDLLGNSAAVDLDLELELTESGTRSTVILQACSVAEELIDADSFSPVPQFNLPINTVITNYTLQSSDSGSLIYISSITNIEINVPSNSSAPFQQGAQILFYQALTGNVEIAAASGVTINAPANANAIAGQYSVAALIKIATNEWVLAGDIYTL
jgi:hypothetical protein